MPATSITSSLASATVATPLVLNDKLLVDSLVTTESGALLQTVTFTLASGVTGITGNAAWNTVGPQLTGVNIDILSGTTGTTVVASDTFAGTVGGIAVSTFNSLLSPGTYRLVATGTAGSTSSLDIAITAVPEPGTMGLLLAGLGSVVLLARRRRSAE